MTTGGPADRYSSGGVMDAVHEVTHATGSIGRAGFK